MAAKSQPRPTDKVVSGCLYQIRAGEMTAFAVLCDRLEEINHEKTGHLRLLYKRWLSHVRSQWHASFKRSTKWTMWHSVAAWHNHYRYLILMTLGWKKTRVKLATLYRKNRELCLALFGEPRHETP